jgi:cytochrome c oxidase subunit I
MVTEESNRHLTRVGWLFLFGAVAFAISGGVTGIILSQAPIDRLYHETYYVVAHFNFIAALAVPSLGLAALYFGLSRVRRFRFPAWAGYLHAAMFFIGIGLTFFPQHVLGRQGMPRRTIDYDEAFALWNWWSTLGAFVTLASLCLFAFVLIWQVLRAWLWPKAETNGVDPRFD